MEFGHQWLDGITLACAPAKQKAEHNAHMKPLQVDVLTTYYYYNILLLARLLLLY